MMDDRELAACRRRILEQLQARYPKAGVAGVQIDFPAVRVMATAVGSLIGKGGVEVERWKTEVVEDQLGPGAEVAVVEVSERWPLEQAALELLQDLHPLAEVEAVRIDDGSPKRVLVSARDPDRLTADVDDWRAELLAELGLDDALITVARAP